MSAFDPFRTFSRQSNHLQDRPWTG